MTSSPYTGISGAGPLRDQVYIALRQDLLAGLFEPAARLGEEKLAEVYGVSRTPIREALARLLADGMVQRGDAGLYPYRPRLEDIADLYELRITLELRGIDRVDGDRTHDSDQLGPIVDLWVKARTHLPNPDAGFVAMDESFHVALLTASGNRSLAEALHAVNARIRPVRMFDELTPDRIAATIDEHITIGSSILGGDLAGARSALLAHIDHSQSVVVERATHALSMAKFAMAVQS